MSARAKSAQPMLTHIEREEREDERRPLSFALIRRLIGEMRPFARKRNALLVTVVLRALQLPVMAWALGAVMGGPVHRADVRGVMLGALGYALLAAFTQVTLHYRSRLALELGEQVIRELRCRMFAHLQRQPMAFFNKTKVGRIISRFASDAEAVRVGVQDVLFVSLVNLGQMIFASVFMVYYDWVLFMVIAAMAPVLWGINRFFRSRLSHAYRVLQESFSRITATLAESVLGVRVTQGFARQDINAGLFQELVADHSRYNLGAARLAGLFIPILEFNSQLFIAAVLLLGGWRVFHGATGVEALYQFILMAGVFFGPIQTLGNQYNQALTAMAGAERVFGFLDAEPEWSDPPDAVALPRLAGRVEFRDVTFGYTPETPVLHEASFVADPGMSVALVGHTGSGKSTIINLIAKFYQPLAGDIFVDQWNLRDADSESLHRQMGIVLQDNFLFTGSIFDNIRVGRPGASDEEILRAAEAIDCRDLIEALPDGFRTIVGEKGSGISLGQRQVVCFIRALLADPSLLILDEATSAVDTITEARLQEALRRLVHGRTSFVVAHRLSTIRNADLVLVLDKGHIVERGTHEELMRLGGVYAGLSAQYDLSRQARA